MSNEQLDDSRLAVRVSSLCEAARAGTSPGVCPGLAELQAAVWRAPSDVAASADDVRSALALLTELDRAPWLALAGGSLTMVAWHLGDRELVERVAAQWLAACAVTAEQADLRAEADLLASLAREVQEVCAVCDTFTLDPTAIAQTWLAAAAACRLKPDLELEVVEMLLNVAYLARRNKLPGGLWSNQLRSAAVSLGGACYGEFIPHPRQALATLLRAFETLQDGRRAQLVRLAFINRLRFDGLIDEAARFTRDLPKGAEAFADQLNFLRLFEAQQLLQRQDVPTALRIVDEVASGIPAGSPYRSMIAQIRASVALGRADLDAAEQILMAFVEHPSPEALMTLSPSIGLLGRLAVARGRVELAQRIVESLRAVEDPLDINAFHADSIHAAWLTAAGDHAGASTLLEARAAVLLNRIERDDQITADTHLSGLVTLAGWMARVRHAADDGMGSLRAIEMGRAWFTRSARAAHATGLLAPEQIMMLDRVRAMIADLDEQNVDDTDVRLKSLRQIDSVGARAFITLGPPPRRPFDQDLGTVLAGLPCSGWAVASVSVLENDVVMAMTDGNQAVSTMVSSGPLFPALQLFSHQFGNGPLPHVPAWRDAAAAALRDLQSVVADPMLDLAKQLNARRIVLSTPGFLSVLPLAAITSGDGRVLLDELDALAVVAGVSSAADVEVRRPVQMRRVWACAANALAPLTALEVRECARTWRIEGCDDLFEDVDQLQLLRQSRTAAVLHVAAHGRWTPGDTASSALVLSNGEEVNVAEIFLGLDLGAAELVVLSACETAVASFSQSGEPMSLSSLMMMAGAARVVGSLWAVDDVASTIFMVLFHRALARGTEAAEAVTSTQRAMRTMTAEQATLLLGELEVHCTSDRDETSLRAAIDGVAATGKDPFASFHLWSPFMLNGLPWNPPRPA